MGMILQICLSFGGYDFDEMLNSVVGPGSKDWGHNITRVNIVLPELNLCLAHL